MLEIKLYTDTKDNIDISTTNHTILDQNLKCMTKMRCFLDVVVNSILISAYKGCKGKVGA